MKMYIPYYFDLQYEFETYKNIGKAHKIDYLSKTRLFYKFKKVIRNCANINETKYKNIDEYSVWKRYIKNKIRKSNSIDKKELIHFLKTIKRGNKATCEMIGAVVTPSYVFILTLAMTILVRGEIGEMLYGFFITGGILFFVLLFLMKLFRQSKIRYYFCKDLINIIEAL